MFSGNGSQKCVLGTVSATGTFRTNGVGGTVYYGWIRKDSSGTHVIPEPGMVIAKGDVSMHSVVADSWKPASSGTEQLFFLSPSYPLAPQAFTCR